MTDRKANLRRQAEETVRGKEAQSPKNLEAISPEETQQILHELRVHQIELEIQNEELLQAQKELEASRARYFDLYDVAPVGYVTLSEKGLILETNLTAATLLGIRRVDLVGRPLSRFIVKEEQDSYYPGIRQLFQTGETQVNELRMVKKDGTTFWAHLEATTALDDAGAPVVCRVAVIDITARKRAEEESRELLLLLESVPNSIVVHNSDGNFLYANQRAFDMHGYNREEFMALNLHRIVMPTSKKQIPSRIQEIVDRGEISFEIEHLKKNGTILPLWINVKKTIWNLKSVLLSVQTDITERKQVEGSIKESEHFLRRIINGSPVPVFIIGRDHRVIYWNKALEEMSKISSKNMVGTHDHWMAFYGDERPCMADLLVDEATELVSLWYSNKYVKSPLIGDSYEGTDFFPAMGEGGKWLRFMATKIRDSKGMIIAAIETLEDITERKRAEDALTEALTRLKFLDDAKRDYLHAISHELRTPMSGMLGIAELALEELGDEQRSEYMAIFESSRNRLLMAVDSALLLAELQGEGVSLPTVPVDLVEIVTSSSCSLQESFLAKDLSIVVPQTQPVLVLGNEELLRQSTTTLLKTALKMSTVGTSIAAQFGEDHDRAILQLGFQGQPLPDKLQCTFFDTFSYDRSSSCVEELGLAIPLAAHVIRSMGGNVDLRETATGIEILMTLLKGGDQKET